MSATLQNCRVVMLVKAMPNPSQKYGETVCCAGVTPEGTWKRLYPIRFRHLQDQFARWDLVDFKYRPPTSDKRAESCTVAEESLKISGKLTKQSDRERLLIPLITESADHAAALGRSLTLIRPIKPKFIFKKKPAPTIEAERQGYIRAARQQSLLDEELEALTPCPFSFAFSFEDAAGRHLNACGDWETSAAYWNLSKRYGPSGALDHLHQTYNVKYPAKGMVFAMGTVKARPKQWLLLGVIRLDEVAEPAQTSFSF